MMHDQQVPGDAVCDYVNHETGAGDQPNTDHDIDAGVLQKEFGSYTFIRYGRHSYTRHPRCLLLYSWVVQTQTEFECGGVWSWWPDGATRRVLSVRSLHPTSAAQQRLFVHTQISLCNYTSHHTL